MDRRTLKIQYKQWALNVEVDDIERCNLIDVLVDLMDEAKKRGIALPRNPRISYTHNKQEIELHDDMTLLRMFEVKSEKVLQIWVGEGSEVTSIWTLAINLRNSQPNAAMENGVANVALDRREKLPIRGSFRLPEADVTPTSLTHTEAVFSKPSPPPVLSFPPCSSLHVSASPALAPHVSPLRKISRLGTSVDNPVAANLPQSSKTTRKTSFNPYKGRKIPKTSAKRAGLPLFIQGSALSTNASQSRARRIKRANGVADVSDDISNDCESNDDDYDPSSEGSSDDYSDDGFTEDNVLLADDMVGVADMYEPNSGDDWASSLGESETYFDSLFENGELYAEERFGSIRLKAWLLFTDKKHFKMVFREYCIQEGFCVVVRKADKGRYTAECGQEGCPFRIHASVLGDGFTWAIKSIHNEHKCNPLQNHNAMATYKWVAHKLVEDIRANNDISIPACNELLQSRYGISMKKSNAYIMKAYALSLIHGGHDISYSYLPSYCEVVKETNLGSVAHCAWREEHITIENGNGEPERPLVFKYIFISFAATLNGFLGGCRGLIGVDGTHLKGNYGGVLLTAIALDGNNEIFPIAHAVVESETKDTWTFFLWHLKDLLKQSDRTDWTIISDRQKGILPAVEQVWPEVRKRICVRHLCKNFKKEYPGPLMHGLFWKLANSYSEFTFKKAIEQMERHAGLGAVYWIKEVGDNGIFVTWDLECKMLPLLALYFGKSSMLSRSSIACTISNVNQFNIWRGIW